MGNFTLKGHISYAVKRKYKWITEFGENTCKKCASLDGKEFDEDNVPPRPHPNFLGIQAFGKSVVFPHMGRSFSAFSQPRLIPLQS